MRTDRLKEEGRRTAKFRVLGLARYGLELARTALGGSPPRVRALIVSDARSATNEEQLAPFYRYRDALEQRLGLVFQHVLLDDVAALLDWELGRWLAPFDVIFLKLHFRSFYNAERIAKALRELAPHARRVYLDGDDDTGLQWPGTVRHLDLYVKKHMLVDRRLYTKPLIGKSSLTDWVARTYDVSFDDTDVGWTTPIRGDLLERVVVGYNLALDAKIHALRQVSSRPDGAPRPHDVHCRATVPEGNWLGYLRRDIAPRLAAMGSHIRALTPTEKVDQSTYYAELKSAKCCVSPFGYGEICWRDFEAILCGSLMLKPDMSHIETDPNVYRAGETYVPLKWDFSDLEEKVSYYVAHEDERLAITRRAYDVLSEALTEDWFVSWAGGLLDRLGLQTEAPIVVES